jgi:peroxiredoxin
MIIVAHLLTYPTPRLEARHVRRLLCTVPALLLFAVSLAAQQTSPTNQPKKAEDAPKVEVGGQAPKFTIKDPKGDVIDLAALTAKGPVLVRLTCGCSGCDKELAYFQKIHEEYKDKGLVSVAVFREGDAKVAAYVKQKKLDMVYAVDSKGASWGTFQTTTMPTNILIDKGGRIVAIAKGCDPSGLLAKRLSEKVAQTVDAPKDSKDRK